MVQEFLSKISFISHIFYQVLYMTIIGSIVGLTVYFIRNIFDKKISGKWKCIMWGIVLLTLLIPIRFEIQTEHQIMPNKIIDKVEDIKNISNYEYLKKEEIPEEISVIDNQNSQETNDMPIMTNDIVNDINVQNQKRMSFRDIVTNIVIPYIWLVGLIAFIVTFLSGVRIINKKIPKKSYKDERIEIILNACKAQLHINKKVRVILQEYKIIPSIFGMISPKILITNQTLQEDDKTIKYIFLHELSHYKRKDILFNYILLCVVSIHWFNPIVWFLFNKIRQDIEVGADELATRLLNKDEKKEYGMVLINLLRKRVKENYTANLLCMSDTGKNMERRISMMKGKSKSTIISAIIGIIVILIIIGIVFVKANSIENNNDLNNITLQDNTSNNITHIDEEERRTLEEYIYKICNGVLNERLPEFDNINNADKSWIYAHIKSVDDPYYVTKEQIEEQLGAMFGEELKVNVDNDITVINDEYILAKSEMYGVQGKYALPIVGMDNSTYYTIAEIVKQNEQYVVKVIEYNESYDMLNDEAGKETIISAYDESIPDSWKWRKIFTIETNKIEKSTDRIVPRQTISEEVLSRKDEFVNYNITIVKNQDGSLNVTQVVKTKNVENNNMSLNNTNIQDNISNNKIDFAEEEKVILDEYIDIICNTKMFEFDNINNANKSWIYSCVRKDLNQIDQYITKEQIENSLIKIFGSSLIVDIEKDIENNDDVVMPMYNEKEEKYIFLPYGGTIPVHYIVNSIEKYNDYYIVNVLEYSVKMDLESDNPEENYAVFSYNEVTDEYWKNWKKIFDKGNESEEEIVQKVLQRKDEFPSYNITIVKNQDGNLNVTQVEEK